jgi:hypothetical protein
MAVMRQGTIQETAEPDGWENWAYNSVIRDGAEGLGVDNHDASLARSGAYEYRDSVSFP